MPKPLHRLAIPAALAIATAFPLTAQEGPTPETVIATVNGTDITLGHMVTLRARLPQRLQQLPVDVLYPGILDQLIQQQLLADTETEPTYGGQVTLENERRAILANQAIRKIAESATTEEAIAAAYEDQYANAEPATEYNASHILVETEEEAAAIVEELAAGADFATLAQERSTGPSGPNGGSLGWFGQGMMVPPFEEAVMALEVGDVSEPVETQFGWHVITVNETRQTEVPSLEDVRAELIEEIQRTAVEARISELTESAEIDRSAAEGLDASVLNDPSLVPE